MDTAGNHLDDFPAESFTILAFCDACHHSAPLDRDRLTPRITVKTLRDRLRCSACGQRHASIRTVSSSNDGRS